MKLIVRPLLSSVALAGFASVPAAAQVTTPAAAQESAETDDDEDSDRAQEVTVTGQKPRGSVVGDIPPDKVLDSRDIRATGATSISELIASVASQTGSARGRGGERPVVLLNGQRISGFRELRDLPPESIERMEILPEEVALKYGYSADQRVLNIVLRRRFYSTTAEVGTRVATEGGYVSGRGEVGRLTIRNTQRTAINARVTGNDSLTESERSIALQPVAGVDPRSYRTLVGAAQSARLTASHSRTVGGDVAATLTGEFEHERGSSRFGVPTGTITVGGTPALRAFEGDPLGRRTISDSAGLGVSLNASRGDWRLSGTGNADVSRRTTRADRGPDLAAAQARFDTGQLTDPLADLGVLPTLAANRGRAVRKSISADATATGPLLRLPAGMANVTLSAGASALGLDSRSSRAGVVTRSDLGRQAAEGSVNLDLPLSRRSDRLGRITANANAGVRTLSDFGTLTRLGAGLNWTPVPRLTLLTSWTREEGAPSIEQLGDPLLETGGVPFFDAVRGETVSVTTLTGGNPALRADRRKVFKVGGNWQPFEKTDLRLRGEFVHQTVVGPQIAFPAATASLEAAFPDRFVRDATGRLVRVDLRPVNADRSTRDTVRIGFDFTKPLRAARPTPEQIQALRARFVRPGGATAPAAGAAPEGAPPAGRQGGDQGARGGFGGGGFGGPGGGGRGPGGGPFGGGRGGRLNFSLTDTITLTDRLALGGGAPTLDYLGGETLSGTGGRSRHQVEAEAGYYNNGLGARVTTNWRSASRVRGGVAGDDLRFGSYGTVDLRLFANLGERLDLVAKSPFFIGSSVRVELNNLFNARPSVRTASGSTPLAYQPGRLEPIGRTVGISFRKLFLPSRFLRARQGAVGATRRPD